MSINWGSVYNSPIGQILNDLNPQTFTQLETQGTATQLNQLQQQLTQINTQLSAWGTLQSDAQATNGALATLDEPSTFQQLQATSSNTNVAIAADSSATAGAYEISIDQLAQTEIDQGTPTTAISSPTTALGLSGTFQIYVGSAPTQDITVSSTDSLQGIVDAINLAQSGVTATAVQLAPNAWGIDIQGNASGSANVVHYVVGTSPTGTNPLQALGFSSTSTAGTSFQSGGTDFAAAVIQSAQDAYANFGAPMTPPAPGSSLPAGMMASSTNTFTGALPGLTLTALSPGTTTVTVAPNTAGMLQSIETFVSQWNQWVNDTASLAESGTVTSTGSGASQSFSYSTNEHQEITSGIPVSTLNDVSRILGGVIGPSSDAFQSLADIGITLSANGTLSINQTMLSNALSSNTSGVAQLFQNLYGALNPSTGQGILPAFYQQSRTGLSAAVIGYEEQQKVSVNNQITLLNSQVTTEEEQATIQYGKWVSQVAEDAQQYEFLTAIFNPPQSTNGG